MIQQNAVDWSRSRQKVMIIRGFIYVFIRMTYWTKHWAEQKLVAACHTIFRECFLMITNKLQTVLSVSGSLSARNFCRTMLRCRLSMVSVAFTTRWQLAFVFTSVAGFERQKHFHMEMFFFCNERLRWRDEWLTWMNVAKTGLVFIACLRNASIYIQNVRISFFHHELSLRTGHIRAIVISKMLKSVILSTLIHSNQPFPSTSEQSLLF
jgi:hypothetical protein